MSLYTHLYCDAKKIQIPISATLNIELSKKIYYLVFTNVSQIYYLYSSFKRGNRLSHNTWLLCNGGDLIQALIDLQQETNITFTTNNKNTFHCI